MQMNENDTWYEDDTPAVLNEPFTAEELGKSLFYKFTKHVVIAACDVRVSPVVI
jgi:hypothetical protein